MIMFWADKVKLIVIIAKQMKFEYRVHKFKILKDNSK